MVLDPRKRQKKQERRRLKDKKRHERLAVAKRNASDMRVQFLRSSRYPVLHCCMFTDLSEGPLSNVLFSRLLPDGRVVWVVFLVDQSCLGVKDVTMGSNHKTEYESHVYQRLTEKFLQIDLTPASCRHLVEGAVEYAAQFGLPPTPDYDRAKHIFGDVDRNESERSFEYGVDGKPRFCSGPFDTPERCRRILATLHEACGPGGYDYILQVSPGTLGFPKLEGLESVEDGGDDGDENDGDDRSDK